MHKKTTNTNPSLQWEWLSLDHQGLGKAGVVIGGSVEYSLVSSIPTIGLYHATMDLDFKVEYSLVCKGSPFSIELLYNSQKAFNVND